MSVLVNFNGSAYLLPTSNETGWATPVSNFFVDLGANALSATATQTATNKLILAQPGAVGAPSLSFASDTDTGIYQPATGQLAIAQNGVKTFALDGSGLLTATAVTPSAGDNSSKLATTAYVATATAASSDAGRNKLHNPLFNIQQRGQGAWTTTGQLMVDRWQLVLTLDTVSATVLTLTDADRTAIGDEEAASALQFVYTGSAGATAFSRFEQHIENVRRLAGKTVTFSFWTKASIGTPPLGVSMLQNFGSGGSPSSAVPITAQTSFIASSWARHSYTFAVPSISGKTVGTSADYTSVQIWFSSGANNNTNAGGIGVSSSTMQIWGMQLEIGTLTSLEKPDPLNDHANCHRFYFVSPQAIVGGFSTTTTTFYCTIPHPVTMRATPSTTPTWGTLTNASSNTVSPAPAFSVLSAGTTASGSMVAVLTSCTFSADL